MRAEDAEVAALPGRGLQLAESPSETARGRQTSKARSRGRPRKVIDREELLDAVEQLFREGGLEAVSIERAAQELGVSRATLYRTVPTKEHMLGLLFRRMTDRLTARALEATRRDGRSAAERLRALIRIQVGAAIEMRDYMFVFFGGGWLSPEDYLHWRRWSREYERIWVKAIQAAADEGALEVKDPVTATRLVLGMLVWVSRWYRPNMKIDADSLAEEAIGLLGCAER
jgi:AcrR family transcriptional regulator